jgi:hypothetical protein
VLAASLVPMLVVADLPNADHIARLASSQTLEEIAFGYGTDKSKDDHKYVDFYMTLFDPIRWSTRNVTEVGVATGQSLQTWADYFSEAHIWGLDKTLHNTVKHAFEHNPRVTLKVVNAYSFSEATAREYGWAKESMDVIIDDAIHHVKYCEKLLVLLWPYVRPGGYYIIEDVGPPAGDASTHVPGEPTAWNEEHFKTTEAAAIVKGNTAYMVDTSFGHRNFSHYVNTSYPLKGMHIHARDRYWHTSHLIVLRKRTAAHAEPPWKQFTGIGKSDTDDHQEDGGAMTRGWIYERMRKSKAATNEH